MLDRMPNLQGNSLSSLENSGQLETALCLTILMGYSAERM